MTTIYQYRIWCNTENTYVYTWGDSAPTLCPNNTTDTIDTDSIAIVQTISTPVMRIENNVTGIYQSTTISLDVPSGATGSTYTHNISFPFDTYIWLSNFVADSSMVGDELTIIIGPDTVVGYVTVPATSGTTTLHVSGTVIPSGYVVKGVEMAIDDGFNYYSLGRILSIDAANNIITFENALPNNYNPGSLLKLNINLVKNQYIGVAGKTYSYGRKGFSVRKIDAGRVIRFNYKNNNGSAKTLHFDMEYNYE